MSRLVLQICSALLALIPIAEAPVLDSSLRFFGGIWLGIGLAMLWLVPSIERQGAGPVPRHTVIDRDSLS
jgi:Domain of unknown function (DUF4345)